MGVATVVIVTINMANGTEKSMDKVTTTLLDNWVEERQCQAMGLEEGNYNEDGSMCPKLQRQGHKGLLTTDKDIPVECTSTTIRSYDVPVGCGVLTTGFRTQMLTKHALDSAMAEVEEETQAIAEIDMKDVMTSTTQKDYYRNLPPEPSPKVSVGGDSTNQNPASFWIDNINNITGVTGTSSAPFNKNTSFSTPVEQRFYQEI